MHVVVPDSFNRDELTAQVHARHDRNFNCAQSIICTLGPLMGADEDVCFRLAEGLGGGLGAHTETCGALLGAAMAASLARSNGCADPTSKLDTYEIVAKMTGDFRQKHGTAICSALRMQDTSGATPPRICLICITDATLLAIDAIEKIRDAR